MNETGRQILQHIFVVWDKMEHFVLNVSFVLFYILLFYLFLHKKLKRNKTKREKANKKRKTKWTQHTQTATRRVKINYSSNVIHRRVSHMFICFLWGDKNRTNQIKKKKRKTQAKQILLSTFLHSLFFIIKNKRNKPTTEIIN